MQTERFTYGDAAKALGISIDAVRMRVRRGTLASERDESGNVRVVLTADQIQPDPDETDNALVAHLQEEIEYLREENRRKDHIVAALVQRVPALEAASNERHDVPASRDEPMEGHPSTGSPGGDRENQSSRGWWSRLFR